MDRFIKMTTLIPQVYVRHNIQKVKMTAMANTVLTKRIDHATECQMIRVELNRLINCLAHTIGI